MKQISEAKAMPLYMQLTEMLREQIESGTLQPNEMVPSERVLEAQYGISRMTARHALSVLESEGLVYRKQGMGTFVAQPRITQGVIKLTSFTEEMRSKRINPGAKVLHIHVFSGDRALADTFGVSAKEEFVSIQRIRTADGDPIALETSTLRRKFCPGIEKVDLNDRSLCQTLEEKFQIFCERADQTLEARLADDYEAEVLKIEHRAPVLYMERLTYIDHGKTPIEFVRYTYPGDKYKFHVELK